MQEGGKRRLGCPLIIWTSQFAWWLNWGLKSNNSGCRVQRNWHLLLLLELVYFRKLVTAFGKTYHAWKFFFFSFYVSFSNIYAIRPNCICNLWSIQINAKFEWLLVFIIFLCIDLYALFLLYFGGLWPWHRWSKLDANIDMHAWSSTYYGLSKGKEDTKQ